MLRRTCSLLAALLLAVAVAGCSGSDEPAAKPTARPTPIAKLGTATVRLARAKFCDLVPGAEVRRALGSDPAGDESWSNGDPVSTDSGSGDTGHEIGCAWTATGGAAARAWVFARPVDAALARTVAAAAGKRRGCTAATTPVFGSPAVLQRCTLPGNLVRERRAGLFGDAWLTCELTLPASVPTPAHVARLDAWCATVVAALRVS